MAKKKNNKSKIYGLIAILLIASISIFWEKIKADNINNLVEQVTNSNEIIETAEKLNISEMPATANVEDNSSTVEGENVVIYYLDVGQADSILIQSNGKNMLIDAGTNDMGKTVIADLKKYGVGKIDYLIGTHPHEDHIGGMDDVINNFDIGTIYMPKVQTNTKTFEDVLDAISNKGLKVTTPEVGYKFMVGDASCEIMCCGKGKSNEVNNLNLSSIVIRMTYGKQSFLFMGDAETENETARDWPQTNVLKVGHHGSNTSTSKSFLEQVKPEIAIISVGKENKYGHPKQETLDKLKGITIYRTDENGTITITCDGEKNVITTEK